MWTPKEIEFVTQATAHRAFEHVLLAGPGYLMAIPIMQWGGSLDLTDRCPVPWIEAVAVIDTAYDQATPLVLSDRHSPLVRRLFAVADGWRSAPLEFGPPSAGLTAQPVRAVVLMHSTGVRMAMTHDVFNHPVVFDYAD